MSRETIRETLPSAEEHEDTDERAPAVWNDAVTARWRALAAGKLSPAEADELRAADPQLHELRRAPS